MFWIAIIHNSHLLYCCRFFSLPTLLYFYQVRTTWNSLLSSRNKHREFRYLRKQIILLAERLTPEQLKSKENCAICLESFDKKCRQLNCGHVFHLHCIQQWIEKEKTCPTCRFDLLKNKTQAEINTSSESETETSNSSDDDPAPQRRTETRIQGNFLGMRFGISYSFNRQEPIEVSSSSDSSDYIDLTMEDQEIDSNHNSVVFTREIEDKISQVMEILPDVDRDRISTVLRLNGGHVNATVNYLLAET